MSTEEQASVRELHLRVQEDPTPEHQTLSKRQQRKNVLTLAVTTFFAGSANCIYYTFYNQYFLAIENNVQLVGIISTVASVFAVLGLIVSDVLYSKIGYKRVIILAQLLLAGAFAFFIFRPNAIIWVIIAVFLLSFTYSLNEAPSNIIITETAGEKKKGQMSSLISIYGRIGEVVVNSIVSIVAVIFINFTNTERSYFFIYSSVTFVLIAVLLQAFVTDPAKAIEVKTKPILQTKETKAKRKTKEKQVGIIRSFVNAFKDKWVLKVAIVFFFDALLWSIGFGVYFAGLLSKELLGIYRLDDYSIGVLLLFLNIAVLVAQIPAGWLVDRLGAKTILFLAEILGIAWAVISIVFVFFPQHFWIILISRVVIGVHIALWIPASVALFTNVKKERKSKVYNAIASFRTIGWIPGGMIAGIFYKQIPQPFGFIIPLAILSVGLVIITPFFYRLSNKPPEEEESLQQPKKEEENKAQKE